MAKPFPANVRMMQKQRESMKGVRKNYEKKNCKRITCYEYDCKPGCLRKFRQRKF